MVRERACRALVAEESTDDDHDDNNDECSDENYDDDTDADTVLGDDEPEKKGYAVEMAIEAKAEKVKETRRNKTKETELEELNSTGIDDAEEVEAVRCAQTCGD